MTTRIQKKSRARAALNLGRWMSYAAAGAVTAVAATNDAEAGILYSGVLNLAHTNPHGPHHTATAGSGLFVLHTLASNSHPGVKSMMKVRNFFQTTGGLNPNYAVAPKYFVQFQALKNGGANISHGEIRGYVHTSNFASRLPVGANVSGGSFLASGRITIGAENYIAGHKSIGAWRTAGTGYLDFRFNDGGGEQYGWVRVTMSGAPNDSLTVVDYAYGTPGQVLVNGQTAVTPEPASLGLLALGALGLLAMRRGKGPTRNAAAA